ncbi:MAG TPA: flippase [Candidatus Dormibacteraeota bacterium]|nr:flippase [Candidatus Dormibacteraeota bacterium]
MSRGGLIARNAAFLFGGQAVSWSLGLVFIVVVPRSVGASAWGEWSLAWALTSVAASFSSMGLTTLLIKEISRDQSRAREYIGAAITAQAMLAVPFLLLILAFINSAGYSAHTRLIITLVTAASLVAFLAVPVSAGLQALEKMHYSSLGQILTSGVLSLIAVLLVKFAAVGMVTISVAAVAAAVAAASIQLYGLSRRVRVWPRGDWKLIRHLIVGGLPYWASGLFLTFYVWIDTVMLSLMTSTTEVGWYGAATRLISTLGVLPYIINMAIFPALSHGFRHDREGMSRLAQTSLRIVLSLGLPMVVGVVLLGPLIVQLLYGWAFAPAAPIVVVLCLTLLPIFTATLVNGQLVAADRQLAWTGVMTACCVVNPVLNLTLIALFERLYQNGALGASYALLITDSLVGVAAVALLPRDVLGKMGVILPQLGRAALAAGIMGAAVFLLRQQFVLIQILTGVATFTVAALILRVFTPADLDLVRRLTGMLGARLGLRQFRAGPPVDPPTDDRLGEPTVAAEEIAPATEARLGEPAAAAREGR